MKLPRLPAAKSVLDAKYTKEQMIEYALKAMAQEREACAKVCEELDKKNSEAEWGHYLAGWSDGTEDCAAAIRARGQA